MKKAPKGKTGRGRRIRRWILVLLALLLVFAAVTLAWDPFRLIVREGTAAHKAEIMEFVESHSQEILENIRKKDYAPVLLLLCDAGFDTANYKGLKIAAFMTHGTEGFYYTAEDQAGDLPALEAPWMKYDGATWIQKELEPEGNGWAWYMQGRVATVLFHEPEYHTEKICDNLWYYQLFFRKD